jgi:ubiquitin carboxyl-terminal hydrolase 8
VLLIHLKRFSFKGPFTDKIEKLVDFPLKGLDLTNYMPPPLPPGIDRKGTQTYPPDDPRSQIPPYRYDLYGVTNHFGSLSSGHCTFKHLTVLITDHVMNFGINLFFFVLLDTAFIASRGGWLYCDDSRVTQANAKEVVVRHCFHSICPPVLLTDRIPHNISGQASICSVLQAGKAMKWLRLAL